MSGGILVEFGNTGALASLVGREGMTGIRVSSETIGEFRSIVENAPTAFRCRGLTDKQCALLLALNELARADGRRRLAETVTTSIDKTLQEVLRRG